MVDQDNRYGRDIVHIERAKVRSKPVNPEKGGFRVHSLKRALVEMGLILAIGVPTLYAAGQWAIDKAVSIQEQSANLP